MLNMIARVGNDPCPPRLRNEWLSPCAASTLPSVGLEICASCATRGTCIRTHLLPTACREAAITNFGDDPNASITRRIAGCLRFFTLIRSGERPVRSTRQEYQCPSLQFQAIASCRRRAACDPPNGESSLSLPPPELVASPTMLYLTGRATGARSRQSFADRPQQ